MLTLLYGEIAQAVLSCDDYSITHNYDGQDQLKFSLSRFDPARTEIFELARIYETTEKQIYVVNYIDASDTDVTYTCDLDLTDWKKEILPAAVDGFSACNEAMTSALPAGWELIDTGEKTEQVIMQLENKTPLEIALAVEDAFFCCLRFDNNKKTVTVIYPDNQENNGVRFTPSKNLQALPTFQGKSSDLVTRLYPYGKDGLTIADVNGGLEYIDNNQYTDEVICAVWSQSSYDDPTSLLRDATLKLKLLSQPTREWAVNAYDLYRIDPEAYSDQAVHILDRVEVYDDNTGKVYEALITTETVYPHYPQQNAFVLRSGWSADSTFRARIEKMLSDDTYTVTRTGSSGFWSWTYNKRATTCKVVYRQQMDLNVSGYTASSITITIPSNLEYCAKWDRSDFAWFTCTEKRRTVTPTLTENDDGTFTISFKANIYKATVGGTLVVTFDFVDTAGIGESIFNTSIEWNSGSNYRYVYYQSNPAGYLMYINKNRTVYCIGYYDKAYVLLTQPDGQDFYRCGFVTYAGGISEEILDNSKTWTNGSSQTTLYKENTFKSAVKYISANEVCRCLGYIDGAYIVMYTTGSHYGIGFTNYDGGVII